MKKKIEKVLRSNLPYLAMSEIEKTVDALNEALKGSCNKGECKVDDGDFAEGDWVKCKITGMHGVVAKIMKVSCALILGFTSYLSLINR